MENDIKVSIICNTYNQEKYIKETLEGFVNQKTDFLFEVLVHDDASTDNTAGIIKEYEEKYPELIKPIYQTENQYSKKVKIIKTFQVPRIKGEFVAFCEGDDCWIDNLKLQKQYDFMSKHPEYSMCATSTIWYNLKTGIKEKRCQITEDRDVPLEEIISGKKGGSFQTASIFTRKDVFCSYPEWRSMFPIGDFPLFVLAALKGKVRMFADVTTLYRFYAENSWTVRMDNEESRARISKQMITALEALNRNTEYKHDSIINKRILKHKYTLALMEHDWCALKSGELKEMYKSRSAFYRLSDYLRCKYPKLYNVTMKPLAKRIKSKRGE